jgi:hypothetical protein
MLLGKQHNIGGEFTVKGKLICCQLKLCTRVNKKKQRDPYIGVLGSWNAHIYAKLTSFVFGES